MSFNFTTGVAICTYNRSNQLGEVIRATLDTVPLGTQVVVCDDGSTDKTMKVVEKFPEITYIRGPNKGVGANKNRAIYALRNLDFIAILEDDLVPIETNWFEMYIDFCLHTNIHHFCRVQDKTIAEVVPDFTTWCMQKLKLTPIYGPSPRGDLTVVSNMVIRKVGAFHPEFVGVGHAHGQWSDRVASAGLIPHPNLWIDVKEASQKFKQLGDTKGGRWDDDPEVVKEQIKANSSLRKRLSEVDPKTYIEPFLP